MKNLAFVVVMTSLVAAPALAQTDRNTPRPIAALDTVWIEDMTWMEVRDAIKAGKTTVIVAAGSVEQNGPYVANGKHNYNERADAEAIARRLGNALVAPVIPIGASDTSPEGDTKLYPGTFAIRSDVFKMMVTDVCASLKQHGFKDIVLISDNHGNDIPLKQVDEALNKKWAGGPTKVHYLPEYPAKDPMDKTLPGMGISEKREPGIHDEYRVTALLMMVNPEYVRLKERIAAGKTTVNGVSIVPAEKTIANAKKLFEIKIATTVEAIKKAVAPEKATR